ncbi:hypothetical protein [Yonghaparkia sp. Root332]|nr:hypothetical protein [Yonghaparkia sp. Root332]
MASMNAIEASVIGSTQPSPLGSAASSVPENVLVVPSSLTPSSDVSKR